jgi:hypothetical protein
MSLTAAQLKGLFHQLVRAAGGVEAAGAVLGVSHQRVSQLQSVAGDQLPNVLQIVSLESFVGQPIVTGFLARLCEDSGATSDPVKEAVEVVGAAAEVIDLVSRKAAPKDIAAAIVRLKDEADDVTHAVNQGA